MQKDFHFYTIYVLARCAGFSKSEAETVAYASQFTDDATEDSYLVFKNGGFFQPIVTSHNYHSLKGLKALSIDIGYRVWIPFHFMPGGNPSNGKSEDNFYRLLEVKPAHFGDNSPADRVIKNILFLKNKPYLLHLLGIALHMFADTWSHQGFIGLTRYENDVKDLKIKGNIGLWEKLKLTFHDLAPKTGHAEALYIPDEPYRCWKYKDYKNNVYGWIENIEIALSASYECYQILESFLKIHPEFSKSKKIPFENIKNILENLFSLSANLEERCKSWQNAIENEIFLKKEKSPVYNKEKWFKNAIKIKNNFYYWRSNFFESDYRLFHVAASYYRSLILYEILPQEGIVCG